VIIRLPRNTIRLRLTLAYGGLFLASGAALLTLTYFLARSQYTNRFFITNGTAGIARVLVTRQDGEGGVITKEVTGVSPPVPGDVVSAAASAQSGATLHTLLVDSAIALGAMSVLSLWLGWLVAGRALSPLRTITSTAREISAQNLHRRLALKGPDDELKQLGNTFDELLGRLERAFEAQRRFVANASHELRTPLTFERTLLEVVLADPEADAADLRRACEQLLANGAHQERLIEALLTLSRSQRGVERRDPVDLAVMAARGVRAVPANGVTVDASLLPARTSGDERLLERLVANLVTNAVRHNVAGGLVEVRTDTRDGEAILSVKNTGPVVPTNEVDRLFEPFQRLDGGRASDGEGLGLGLSIVRAIAEAHDATVSATPRDGGGLAVEVAFAAARTIDTTS
jgi:signal transduction histidine kinase